MKVLLLNSPFDFGRPAGQSAKAGARWAHRLSGNFVPFPFFLAYAAGVLKKHGHEVKVIDGIAENIDKGEVLKRLKFYKPELVFMEGSTPSIDSDLKYMALIKENCDVITVLGGSHATALAEDLLKENSCLDYILMNEYDFTLEELASALDKKITPGKIKGLCRREMGGVICSNEAPYVENLDDLPWPARELFPMSAYNEGLCERPNAPLMSSRGCPYNCIFCLWPQSFYGTRRYRFRSTSLVADEIEMLLKTYKPREIYFDDDTFTIHRDRVLEICREIKRRNLKFEWDCLGQVINMDRDLLAAMKEAGCNRIRYGVETGNDDILKRINKPITSSRIKEIFNLTKENGIRTHATVAFGLPGETNETMRETIKFILEINPDTVQFSMATPFPGTKFFELAKEKGWLRNADWPEFDGHTSAVLNLDDVKAEEIENAYKEAQAVWAIHRRRRGDNPWWVNLKELVRHPLKAIKFLRYYKKYLT